MSSGLRRRARRARRACLAAAVAACVLGALVPATTLAAPGPHWIVSLQAAPTHFEAGSGSGYYQVLAENDGGAATTGTVTLTDSLPSGVLATDYGADVEGEGRLFGAFSEAMTCAPVAGGQTIQCTTPASIPSGRFLIAKIAVEVSGDAAGSLEGEASVSGGGAAVATATTATPVTNEPVPYGAAMTNELTDEEGDEELAAGGRPFDFTTLLDFNIGSINTMAKCDGIRDCGEVAANTRDVEVAMPVGLVGNPAAVPRCPQGDFQTASFVGCPADTQVGDVLLIFGSGTAPQLSPVYDVEPPPGEPAELGFTISTLAHVPIYFHVRTEGDYGVTADIPEISEFDPVTAAALTLWGVPAAAAHDPTRRGIECEVAGSGCAGAATVAPFLTMPTSCSEAGLSFGLASDSWQEPLAAPLPTMQRTTLAGTIDCASLPFAPALAAQPTDHEAGAPTGYELTLDVPQHEGAKEVATADVRDAQVTLPAGALLSASSGNGLVACTEEEFAPKSRAVAGCPPQSKIGTARIVAPLLLAPMTGSLYLAEPECDPCDPEQAQEGRMVKLYLDVEGSGVVVKLAGEMRIAQPGGRLTASFEADPQLPFSEVAVTIDGGQDAPLANARSCEASSATGELTPWSTTQPVATTAAPVVLEGCRPPSFAPSLSAGMTSSRQGGSYSGFVIAVARPAGDQALGSVVLHTPAGIAAKLSSVPLCGEPQANEGTCPTASRIGAATAVAGPGEEPLTIEGGKVYLTGPYGGAPFGLSIVLPAEVGPFHLSGQSGDGGRGDGNVVVRASIALNPRTTALTIATTALPSELDGIPLEVQKLIVDLDRESFVLNPTSCKAMSITSTITSTSGAAVSSSYPFQSTGCASLPFAPKIAVATHAGHTRKDGAYLNVKVTTRNGEADVHKVHVTLPEKLPARLATLKLACTEAQFAANPSNCPKGSVVGYARADTAVLPAPLTGPAIFVSRGGAEFPNLDLVMQGDGVTVILEGDTFINKAGITSSTFGAIPDVPVRTFEVTLPAGANSALAGTGGFCREALHVPTTISGQNGAVVERKIAVKVSGCRPEIEVLAHRVRAATARIAVGVPGPGRLVVLGRGISRVVRSVARAKTATVTVKLSTKDRRLLAARPGRRLRVKVKLRFHLRRGGELSSYVTVLMR